MAGPILRVEGLRKSFGGTVVLDGVSLAVDRGRIYGVIGPNGAGKTTVFNLITGVYDPDAGDIRLDGESLCGIPPHRRTRLGIARTFQTLRLFLNMSVKENVMAATYCHTRSSVWQSVLRTRFQRREEREVNRLAEEKLGFLGQRLMGYRWEDRPRNAA